MSNDTRPTPETDDAARKGAYLTTGEYPETCGKQIVHIDFARKLERERDEFKEKNLELAVENAELREQNRVFRDTQKSCEDCDAATYAEVQAMREAVKELRESLVVGKDSVETWDWCNNTIAKLQPFITP